MNKKQIEIQNKQWNQYKKFLGSVPTYLILQKASDIVFAYSDTKRPITISWFDTTDDFVVLWQKLEQISNDLDKLAIIDKALKTIRSLEKSNLPT